jgi:alkanesulfonate monooxygenase SsuD/methylene tetrahydromethanopterin reductase-like flavin-dependent oxidoreductase (luciferase family)
MATFSTDGTPATAWREAIDEHLRRLEGHLSSVWVQDHLMPEMPTTPDEWDCLEAWSTLAHYAAAYPSYRFGHIVLGNSYRSPALLAKMAATTQLLIRGRLILGIGAGWAEPEYRAYNLPYPPPKVRIAQLAEAVQLIKAMWSDSPATFQGEHYRIENMYSNPRPNPAPPIMIGGGGEQLLLRVVAQHADWYNCPGLPIAGVAHKLQVLRRHCDAVGRDYDEIYKTGSSSTVAVANTRAEAERLFEASPFKRPGAGLVGEPGDVAEQLRAYADLGIRHMVLRFADFPRLDSAMLFAERVLPMLR